MKTSRSKQLEREYFAAKESGSPERVERIYKQIEKEDREEYLANLLGLTIAGIFLLIVVAVWSLLNNHGI